MSVDNWKTAYVRTNIPIIQKNKFPHFSGQGTRRFGQRQWKCHRFGGISAEEADKLETMEKKGPDGQGTQGTLLVLVGVGWLQGGGEQLGREQSDR